eukprot:SAG31_NODE_5531_length_2473_cov_1.272957_2_plen_681_part_01
MSEQATHIEALERQRNELQTELTHRVASDCKNTDEIENLQKQLAKSEQWSESMLTEQSSAHIAALKELSTELDSAQNEKKRVEDALKQVLQSPETGHQMEDFFPVPDDGLYSLDDAHRDMKTANELLAIAVEEEQAANHVADRAIELVHKAKLDKSVLLTEAADDAKRIASELETVNQMFVEVDTDRKELARNFANVVADVQRQKIETKNSEQISEARTQLHRFLSIDNNLNSTSGAASLMNGAIDNSFLQGPMEVLAQERLTLAQEVTELAKEAALAKMEEQKLRDLLDLSSTAEIPDEVQRLKAQLLVAETDQKETNFALEDAERRLREMEVKDEERIEERITHLKARAEHDARALHEAEARLRRMELSSEDAVQFKEQAAHGIATALEQVAALESRAKRSESIYLQMSEMLASAEQHERAQNEMLRANAAELAEVSLHRTQLVSDVSHLTAELDAVTALVEAVPEVTKQQTRSLECEVVALATELDAANAVARSASQQALPSGASVEVDAPIGNASVSAEEAALKNELEFARTEIRRKDQDVLRERARAEGAEMEVKTALATAAATEVHNQRLNDDLDTLTSELDAVTSLVGAVPPVLRSRHTTSEKTLLAAAESSAAAAEAVESAALIQAQEFESELHAAHDEIQRSKCVEEQLRNAREVIEHKEAEVASERARAET